MQGSSRTMMTISCLIVLLITWLGKEAFAGSGVGESGDTYKSSIESPIRSTRDSDAATWERLNYLLAGRTQLTPHEQAELLVEDFWRNYGKSEVEPIDLGYYQPANAYEDVKETHNEYPTVPYEATDIEEPPVETLENRGDDKGYTVTGRGHDDNSHVHQYSPIPEYRLPQLRQPANMSPFHPSSSYQPAQSVYEDIPRGSGEAQLIPTAPVQVPPTLYSPVPQSSPPPHVGQPDPYAPSFGNTDPIQNPTVLSRPPVSPPMPPPTLPNDMYPLVTPSQPVFGSRYPVVSPSNQPMGYAYDAPAFRNGPLQPSSTPYILPVNREYFSTSGAFQSGVAEAYLVPTFPTNQPYHQPQPSVPYTEIRMNSNPTLPSDIPVSQYPYTRP